ncbi:MAG: alanine racemase [Holophaga sp.]|jgi:alanine racemase
MLYQTHMRVSLENIRRNLEAIRSMIGPEPRLLLAVKCNGYGMGAPVVATMAERQGLVDWFGVATVPEGLEVRQAGVRLPVLKFSPAFPEEMEAALDHGITLAVCERANIKALQSLSAAKGARPRVHLKVETGLGRTGVAPPEAPELAVFIEKNCPNLRLEGVFTHMAASGVPQGDAYTEGQFQVFMATIRRITEALGRRPELLHCANSGVVLRHGRETCLSMVRVGQAAYGVHGQLIPKAGAPALHSGLISFQTRISFRKKVAKGTRIGYGLGWEAQEDTWIGTIPMGWGDGFSRSFSNFGRVLVDGKFHPIVGTMSMDQSMIDLGPETDAQVGDEVILIGRSKDLEITPEELAEVLKTIPYEIICRIGPRVRREYGLPGA